MPVIDGSTTASTAAAVTAASIALPPSCSTFSPAAEASGWLVAIIPFLPSTAERVPCGFAAGRSPGRGRESAVCAEGTVMTANAVARASAVRFMQPPVKNDDVERRAAEHAGNFQSSLCGPARLFMSLYSRGIVA